MPDQDKKMYDHGLVGAQERYLNMYGPHSPANSDSPLSLVVRKEDALSHVSRKQDTIKLGLVDSPGRSSGFSEGSYESSPNRSPVNSYESQDKPAKYPSDDQAEEKPLSLVIRKSLVAGAESKEEYTVHNKHEDGYWTGQAHEDSGNDDSEHALVISEDVKDQDLPQDFSNVTARSREADPDQESQSHKSPAIKIKSFAKILDDPSPGLSHEGPHTVDVQESSNDQSSTNKSPENPDTISDVTSEASADSISEGTPYTYGTEVEMTRVTKTASGESLYQCGFCDKLFANKSHLQSHLVTHTGERAFTCKLCCKNFGRKSTLRAHMTTHTKVSNFMCGVCEKACNDNNSLEEHMRMHTGEKPFVCTICQKAYARKSHLNVHYRVHTGERPFVCERCNKDFTEKRFLNDHLQTAHNGADGPLKCPNCFREFAYKTSLKQHLKKQMCERNIKRTSSNSANGAVAKQFQCPFCDKSYSWKQTLKQHVSMYHRNQIHTDEFWRYELTKNRRTVMDDKANEDLWKKQLGKHAEETARQKLEAENAAAALASLGSARSITEPVSEEGSKSHEEIKWMEQISRTATAADEDRSVSTEMKLLALQSLQNSLRFMSMGMSIAKIKTEPAASAPSPAEAAETQQPPQESYLNLLAQLAKRESEERKSISENNNNSGVERKEMSSNDATVNNIDKDQGPVPPTKEESSVKRTQMWLQQVNKYRHRPPKEELEANHDELWEQQISRVKKNPVRSPLEPEEIVIEDETEAPAAPQPIAPVARDSRSNTLNNNNNYNDNNNNINIINNNNNNTVINNNTPEGVTIFPARIILAHPVTASGPGAATLTFTPQFLTTAGPASHTGGHQPQPLKVFLHQPLVPAPQEPMTEAQPRQSTDTEHSRMTPVSRVTTPVSRDQLRVSRDHTPVPPSRESSPARDRAPGDDGSMLKSLLLDRMKRKRSSSNDTDAASKRSLTSNTTGESSKASRPISIPEGPSSILHKRLLGWVDPTPAPPPAPKAPRTEERTASRSQSNNSNINNNNNNNNSQPGQSVFQIDLENKEDQGRSSPSAAQTQSARRENVVTYANTSVLKHLLHRYTETKQ